MTNQNEVKWTLPERIPPEIREELDELIDVEEMVNILEIARYYVNLYPTDLERAMNGFCREICDDTGVSELFSRGLAEIIQRAAVREGETGETPVVGGSREVNLGYERPIVYAYDRSQVPEFSGVRRVTRSQSKDIAVLRIKKMLAECAETRGRESKILITKKIMDYIVTEGKACLIDKYEKFRETVKKKLIEFSQNEKVFYPDHYWILFHEVLPGYDELLTEYRNSLHLIEWRSS